MRSHITKFPSMMTMRRRTNILLELYLTSKHVPTMPRYKLIISRHNVCFYAGLHWKCTPTALANDKKTRTTITALGSTERTRISCVLLTFCWSVKRQAKQSTSTLSSSVLPKSSQMAFVSLQYPKDTKLRYYFNGCKARNISLQKLPYSP